MKVDTVYYSILNIFIFIYRRLVDTSKFLVGELYEVGKFLSSRENDGRPTLWWWFCTLTTRPHRWNRKSTKVVWTRESFVQIPCWYYMFTTRCCTMGFDLLFHSSSQKCQENAKEMINFRQCLRKQVTKKNHGKARLQNLKVYSKYIFDCFLWVCRRVEHTFFF